MMDRLYIDHREVERGMIDIYVDGICICRYIWIIDECFILTMMVVTVV